METECSVPRSQQLVCRVCVCVYIFMYIYAYKEGPPQPKFYIPEYHCPRFFFPTELQILMSLQPSLYQISSYIESVKFSSGV